jgi:Protein of unknown function (DUF4435)
MFSRTVSGIRNIHLFYSGFYIVIVEGSSDCPFWSKFFPSDLNGYKRKIKPVGGRLEVRNYIDEILNNEAKFTVAIDSDYNLLLNCLYNHSKIVETQFHSIENLMLYPLGITSVIRDLSHDTEYEFHKVNSWLEKFDLATYPLMVADFFIEKENLGKKCVGENCFPFLVKNNIPEFDLDKISRFLTKLDLTIEGFNMLEQNLESFKPRSHIRGHFLFSAALCFVGHEVKKIRRKSISISNDSFYAMLIASLENSIPIDFTLQNIQRKALLAAKEITELLAQGQ